MFQHTQPAALGPDGRPDDWNEFRVDHPAEVVALLRRLRDRVEPVSLTAPGGHTLGTSVWAIDEAQRRVNLAIDPEHPGLPPLIEAEEVVAVAYLDSIKLQFDLRDLMVVRSARAAALQAALPDTLYRFQRRQAYRVRVADGSSPTVQMRHPALPDMRLALRVLDVSVGGCALLLPSDVPPVQPGTRVAVAAVALDGDTRFETGLMLQHVTALDPERRGVRIGCAWMGLSPSSERALQRYIDQTQKRRRLLTLD